MGRSMTVWQQAPLLVNVCLMNEFNQIVSIIIFFLNKNKKNGMEKKENLMSKQLPREALSDFFHHKLIRESNLKHF